LTRLGEFVNIMIRMACPL